MNPSVVHIQAELQMTSYKKGKIHNIFKVKQLEIEKIHGKEIEHIRFTRQEKYLVIMSSDFRVSIWEVGSWVLKRTLRAYHNAHT